MTQPAIHVQDLTKQFGPVLAVDRVTFDVRLGELVGFLGQNGAGKTTTMRILSCFMPASGGTARVAGYDVFEQSLEVRRRIGYLPENVPLYVDMPVAAYLDFVEWVTEGVDALLDYLEDKYGLKDDELQRLAELASRFYEGLKVHETHFDGLKVSAQEFAAAIRAVEAESVARAEVELAAVMKEHRRLTLSWARASDLQQDVMNDAGSA